MSERTRWSAKDRKKFFRGIVQALILLAVLYWILTALVEFSRYTPYQEQDILPSEGSPGFVAVSYFGVNRSEKGTLIGTDRLNKHLAALYRSGYVTITLQDILDYYNEEKPLPERALFLMFEDGRRDTAIFAQDLMETYNYKATMFSYADRLVNTDSKFLAGKDLAKLEKSTYWELGSNGYRLAYINIYHEDQSYLGEMNSEQFIQVSKHLDRYNHYLMDYIRDAAGVPKESTREMQERIAQDYALMRQVYTDKLGHVPPVYALMHANSGQFGSNAQASAANEQNLSQLFTVNFNREGNPLNSGGSLYDLTRVQPQSYWSTNHLLMRIWNSTHQPMEFEVGDTAMASDWLLRSGAAEFEDAQITVTTLPDGTGALRYAGVLPGDLKVDTRLKGNKLGSQAFVLRADETLSNCLRVEIRDGQLIVTERTDGQDAVLFSESLDGLPAADPDIEGQTASQAETTLETPGTTELSAPVTTELSEGASYQLQLSLQGDTLLVSENGVQIVQGLQVKETTHSGLLLESAWNGEYHSRRRLTDNVYDGIWDQLTVSATDGTTLYTTKLRGVKKLVYNTRLYATRLVDWFIDNL